MVLQRPERPSRTNTRTRYPFHHRVLECKSRKSRDTWSKFSKFGLGVQNEAGQRLTEFCQENALVTTNMLFQQYKRKLYIWTSPDDQYWNQIDYILWSQRWRSSISSVQFSCSVVSDSLRPHGPQHTRPSCPSPTPGVYSNSCPLSQWCHPIISSSVISFSSCLQSFPASGSFQMSQLFASGGQNIGVSASTSVPPMNTQDWSPLGWTGWISLQ